MVNFIFYSDFLSMVRESGCIHQIPRMLLLRTSWCYETSFSSRFSAEHLLLILFFSNFLLYQPRYYYVLRKIFWTDFILTWEKNFMFPANLRVKFFVMIDEEPVFLRKN